jgi:hypothetical protein
MMTEGGHIASWKRQAIDQHRGPPGSYANLQDPLPDPPEGMRWIQDQDTREWSLERKMEEDTFAVEITQREDIFNSDFFQHDIQTSDTFAGICLRYKISPAELRRENGGFSGTNLFLAPNPLKIPKREIEESKVEEEEENRTTAEQVSPNKTALTEEYFPATNGTHAATVVTFDESFNNDYDSDAARAVFEESLRFEHTHSLPPPQPFEDRKSSSTSLYPPIESIEDVDRDEIELEKTWEAAVTPKKKTAASRMKSCCDDEARCTCSSTDSCMSPSSHRYPYLALSNPHAAARATSLRGASPYHPMMPPPRGPLGHGPPWSRHPFQHAFHGRKRPHYHHHDVGHFGKHSAEDDDMIAMKMAAYEGRDSTPAARMPDARMPDQQAEATIVDHDDDHPSDISVNVVQADLVGQDYGSHFDSDYAPTQAPTTQASGYVESVQSVMGTASGEATEATVIESGPMDKVTADAWDASATEALVLEDSTSEIVDLDSKPPAVDQWRDPREAIEMNSQGAAQVEDAAEATVVEFEDHPATVPISSNAIHAEFVGQDFSSSVGYETAPESNFQRASVSTSSVGLMDQTMDIGRGTTEATVIESAQVEEAWPTSDVGEAQVLEGNVDSVTIEEDIASDANHNSWRDRQASTGSIAEVVGITENVHPSELVDNATQAQLIGTDSSCRIPFPSNHSLQESVGVSFEAPAEEARVLHDSPDDAAIEQELKATPNPDSQWMRSDTSGGSFAMADGEAEVVGITENVHPSELVDEATQAELIGTYCNCAIAIPSNHQQEEAGRHPNETRVEDAEIVVEEESDPMGGMVSSPEGPTFQPREAQATIISEREFTHFDRHGSPIPEVAVESDDAQPETPATPVTILQEQSNGDMSSNSPRKSEVPVVDRASINVSNSLTNQFNDALRDTPAMSRDGLAALDAVTEPEWMRTPSFGGVHSDMPPVMAPPSVTVTEVTEEGNPSPPGESSDSMALSEPLNSSSCRLQAVSETAALGRRISIVLVHRISSSICSSLLPILLEIQAALWYEAPTMSWIYCLAIVKINRQTSRLDDLSIPGHCYLQQ